MKKTLEISMERLLKRNILIFLLALIQLPAFGKDKKYDALEQRVTILEDYRNNLDQLYEIMAEKLTDTIEKSTEEKIKDIEETKRILSWLLYLGVPVSLLAWVGVYILAIRKSKKIILEKIEAIVEHKREEIIKLIETQEFDSKLKKTKDIVVLSANEAANDEIKLVFSKLKFSKVKFRIVNEYIEVVDSDLIVFNNYDDSFSQTVIDEYLDNLLDEDLCFVAYTTRKLKPNSRINFSNSPFTLYHSILSTLKYSEILKIKES
jgi:RNAse (barnase) inhibitor barstar